MWYMPTIVTCTSSERIIHGFFTKNKISVIWKAKFLYNSIFFDQIYVQMTLSRFFNNVRYIVLLFLVSRKVSDSSVSVITWEGKPDTWWKQTGSAWASICVHRPLHSSVQTIHGSDEEKKCLPPRIPPRNYNSEKKNTASICNIHCLLRQC